MLGVTRTPLFSILMSWTVKYTRKENTRLNGLILRFISLLDKMRIRKWSFEWLVLIHEFLALELASG